MPSHGFPCWDLLRQFHNTPHTTSYSHVSNDIQSVNSPGFNCCGCGCQGLWLERLAVLRCSQWIKVPAMKQLPAMSPTCQISRNLCDTKTSFERSSNLSTNYCWLFSLYPHCIPILSVKIPIAVGKSPLNSHYTPQVYPTEITMNSHCILIYIYM